MLMENPALNSLSRSGALVVGGSAFRLGPLQSPPAPSFNHALTETTNAKPRRENRWESRKVVLERFLLWLRRKNMPSNSKRNKLLEQLVAKQLGCALIQGSSASNLEAKRRKTQAANNTWTKTCQAHWNDIWWLHWRFHRNQDQERSLLAWMLPLRNFQVQTFRLSNHAQTGNAHSFERRLKR